jgi:hypothetical protein
MSDKTHNDQDQRTGAGADESAEGSRRGFLRKMVWVAPVIHTFLVSEEGVAQNKNANKGNKNANRQGVSPNPGNKNANRGQVPPPPPG